MKADVIILDFGSQFTQLIARAVRELGIYCEIDPFSIAVSKLVSKNPKCLILSGGPDSVNLPASPKLVRSILKLEIPILGICYGMQLLSHMAEGSLNSGDHREYGFSELEVLENEGLFRGFKVGQKTSVWMSHGDSVSKLPLEAKVTARTESCPVAAFQLKHLHGIQFHPEVAHTVEGKRIISNFLYSVCGLQSNWKMEDFIVEKSKHILSQVGESEVIGGVSGGVDSTLLAVFLARILGPRFHPVMVDTGLLRQNESDQVKASFKQLNIRLKVVDASALFLRKLKDVSSPEMKRKIIGHTFIEVFEKECRSVKNIRFLAQGTLYPDVIESVSVKGPSHTIKTHHNVGGLPKRMKLSLIEPFRELFKDEVRELGRKMRIAPELLLRHPFPGPGLAVRILGPVTKERLALLRKADAIFMEELQNQKCYDDIWQAFTVLLPVKAVGVMGDARTYESVVALRAVTSRDGMTADWYDFEKKDLGRVANRIINEVRGINRVVYDISSKPPATIEWE